LSAFVEDELERNPLLERASDGNEPAAPGEPTAERAEFSAFDDQGSGAGDEGAVDPFDAPDMAAGDGFEPAQEEWMNRELGSRTEIKQTLDTGLDNVFPEEP